MLSKGHIIRGISLSFIAALAVCSFCLYLFLYFAAYGAIEARLTDFAKKLTEMQAQYREFYEMEDDDIPFICEHKLKEAGIDVKKMLDK